MRVNVEWEYAAWAQFEQLPPALKQAVREIEASFVQNPYGSKRYSYTITRDGRTTYVHTRAGAEVLVDYYRGGFFGRRLTVMIVGVAPYHQPTLDELEERRSWRR